MTRARTTDNSRGVVFDWTSPTHYEFNIVSGARDFSLFDYLSFRACQGTRHPYTTPNDLTFTVTLRDGDGVTSSINLGAFGGGIEGPYMRSGGWGNAFETVPHSPVGLPAQRLGA